MTNESKALAACQKCGADDLRAKPDVDSGGWFVFHECIARGVTEQEAINVWNLGSMKAASLDPQTQSRVVLVCDRCDRLETEPYEDGDSCWQLCGGTFHSHILIRRPLESQPVAETVSREQANRDGILKDIISMSQLCLDNPKIILPEGICERVRQLPVRQLPLESQPVAGRVIGEAMKSIKADLKEALTIDDKKHFERQIRSALWTAEEALRAAQQPQSEAKGKD